MAPPAPQQHFSHNSDSPSSTPVNYTETETYQRPFHDDAYDDVPPPLFLPGSIDEFVDLMTHSEEMDEEARRRYELIKPYAFSSLVNGRHLNRAVGLVLGVSGHGKSKTINSLVNRDIFSVANTSDGSITEVCIAILF
jgi:hypothetical protein